MLAWGGSPPKVWASLSILFTLAKLVIQLMSRPPPSVGSYVRESLSLFEDKGNELSFLSSCPQLLLN